MTGLIDRIFLEHPRTAGQRYFEHMRFAHRFGGRMFVGALAAFVHGFFPRLCQTTASDAVRALHASLHERGQIYFPREAPGQVENRSDPNF